MYKETIVIIFYSPLLKNELRDFHMYMYVVETKTMVVENKIKKLKIILGNSLFSHLIFLIILVFDLKVLQKFDLFLFKFNLFKMFILF